LSAEAVSACPEHPATPPRLWPAFTDPRRQHRGDHPGAAGRFGYALSRRRAPLTSKSVTIWRMALIWRSTKLSSCWPATPSSLPASRKQIFSASESDFAYLDRQLSDLRADALCHRPAMTRYRVEILRHLILRFRPTELGRIVRLVGSEALVLSTDEMVDVSPASRATKISPVQA
jgi:hypothetical protein